MLNIEQIEQRADNMAESESREQEAKPLDFVQEEFYSVFEERE